MTATLHADKGTLRLESVLMKLGAACAKAPAAWRLIEVDFPHAGTAFAFKLNGNKLRAVRGAPIDSIRSFFPMG